MNILSAIMPLISNQQRRETLLALTAAYMLVQISSFPVALALPTLAEYFETSIENAAWTVIIYLLMLGSLVLVAARLGDRYGHIRVFFVGIMATAVGSGLIALSQDLWQIVVWRALTGLGAALVMGNANAILASTFPPNERGRAFSIPIIGARFGTLVGLGIFAMFLHFLTWRLVFISILPMGFLAVVAAIPMLRHSQHTQPTNESGPIDWIGSILIVVTALTLVLSASHIHDGEQAFTSSEGLRYHLPMSLLFLILLTAFVLVQRRSSNPVIELKHFRHQPFSLALGTNVTYHFSMLATMTLIPILVEHGFGRSPLFVTVVLLPSQSLGLFMPLVAGWIYDKYRPKLLRPATMIAIAGGFLILGLSAPHVSFWMMPLLMLPIALGTNMFNPINNATIMNSLPLEHRGVASGMLETTRELGHALGATAAATALVLSLPKAINLLSHQAARDFYFDGFQVSALMVVFVLLIGASMAYFHKTSLHEKESGSITHSNS